MRIPLENRTLGESLANSLRDRILRGEITIGQPLTEAAVSADYGVARQTAKAAIERLTAEGLLERHANKSARVPHLSHEHIADLYFTRSVIETKAYELLATSGVDAASPRRAHEQVIAAMDDIAGLVVADIEFHADLVGALGSMRLTRAHRTILNEMQLCLAQVQVHRLLDPAIIVREHEEILQAIEAGDPRTAAEAGQRHLDNAKERLLRHVTGR